MYILAVLYSSKMAAEPGKELADMQKKMDDMEAAATKQNDIVQKYIDNMNEFQEVSKRRHNSLI